MIKLLINLQIFLLKSKRFGGSYILLNWRRWFILSQNVFDNFIPNLRIFILDVWRTVKNRWVVKKWFCSVFYVSFYYFVIFLQKIVQSFLQFRTDF